MKEIVVIKKHDGHRVGNILWVTDATAEKRIKDGLCSFKEDLKEEKQVIETKEEKEVIETKEKKRATKAPK